MNILHLHTELNITCGISKTIFLIAKYPKDGDMHYVLAFGGDAGKKYSGSGINVVFLKRRRSFFKDFLYLKKFVKKNEIDIIHSHHRYWDFVADSASRFFGAKRITSVQSFVYGKKLMSYKSPVLLAAGESVKKHLVDYFGVNKKRIVVFNNFTDESEIKAVRQKQEVRTELDIPDDAYVFGYAGRFSVKEKGIDVLADAFRDFSGKYSGARLVMAGGGSDIKKILIPENTLILDSKENIFDYYNIFDCFILPSRVDPFPLACLEAGMMKIPFIGSDVNGIPEMIENNKDGLLFPKEISLMLSEKMEVFYKDRKFAGECSRRFFDKVKEKYNSTKALDKLNRIYRNL
ncbi:MAG: glycosyltransferase family 4 protein [Ignavibacteriae bacterium]|nr:glycosyltransferase family 4 protein [Ignavibacteriota bacterium]